nr:MAG: hypothetical protein DIU70_01915 [Bacillota bacterium]
MEAVKKRSNCPDREIAAMIDSTRHCLHCGRPLKYLPDKDKRRNRGYCCLEHFYARPPRLAWACKVWGFDDPAKVLVYLLNLTGGSTTRTADLLGTTRQTVLRWIRQYRIRRVVRYEVAGTTAGEAAAD